jgi:ketosteroid isomerase-like protein
MSENLDLVRSILAANERGDYSFTDWAHADVEFVIADGPSPGRWSGLAGMTEGWLNVANAWEGLRTVADEYRELDDQRVLVLLRRRGRGKTSGLELGEIGSEGAGLFYVRVGKVTKLVVYFDRERALADLGLAPEGGSPES